MITRHAWRFVIGHVEEGVVHLKWVKNACLKKMLEGLPAQSLYQCPQHVSRYAVVVPGAGLKTQGEGHKFLDKAFEIRALAEGGVAIGTLYRVFGMLAVSEVRGVGH